MNYSREIYLSLFKLIILTHFLMLNFVSLGINFKNASYNSKGLTPSFLSVSAY